MNDDPSVRRVRVRRSVLPALAEVGPDPVGALGRLAAFAAEDDAALDAAAAGVVAASGVVVGDVLALPVAAVARHPVAVQRRVWRRLLRAVAGGPPPSAADVAIVGDLAAGDRVHLRGGVEVAVAGGWCTAAPVHLDRSADRRVAVPGATPWAPAGIVVVARTPGVAPVTGSPTPPGQIAFELSGAWTPPLPDLARLQAPPGGRRDRCHLALPAERPVDARHRRDGDRLRTVAGTARVVDLLAGARVPRGRPRRGGRSWSTATTASCGSPASPWTTPSCTPAARTRRCSCSSNRLPRA